MSSANSLQIVMKQAFGKPQGIEAIGQCREYTLPSPNQAGERGRGFPLLPAGKGGAPPLGKPPEGAERNPSGLNAGVLGSGLSFCFQRFPVRHGWAGLRPTARGPVPEDPSGAGALLLLSGAMGLKRKMKRSCPGFEPKMLNTVRMLRLKSIQTFRR
ncbi:uncharacterized protein ACOB8E_014393 [Sarcophilus harrisii]